MQRLMVHWLSIKICLSDYVVLTRAIINNLEVVAATRSSQTRHINCTQSEKLKSC